MVRNSCFDEWHKWNIRQTSDENEVFFFIISKEGIFPDEFSNSISAQYSTAQHTPRSWIESIFLINSDRKRMCG